MFFSFFPSHGELDHGKAKPDGHVKSSRFIITIECDAWCVHPTKVVWLVGRSSGGHPSQLPLLGGVNIFCRCLTFGSIYSCIHYHLHILLRSAKTSHLKSTSHATIQHDERGKFAVRVDLYDEIPRDFSRR